MGVDRSRMPSLSRIAVHPIKSLDPLERERATVTAAGGLRGDRAYAVVTRDGEYVNGKRTPKVHRLRTDVDLDRDVVTIRIEGEADAHRFDLARDRAALDEWLSGYFGVPVSLEAADDVHLTDSSDPGPTLLADATLREVASWFPGIDPDQMRDRLRPNLVIEGVPAFWEDRLVAGGRRRLRIGDVTLRGRAPVPRCVVPTRDPRTGEEYPGFRETFVRRREATFPDWGDAEAFDTFFALMVSTHVPAGARDAELQVGDEVRLIEEPAEPR